MRDFKIFWRKYFHRFWPGVDPLIKIGKQSLPFTQEIRRYIYVGPIGVEWWTGPQEVKPGYFVDR
jgi:hypothetical protein